MTKSEDLRVEIEKNEAERRRLRLALEAEEQLEAQAKVFAARGNPPEAAPSGVVRFLNVAVSNDGMDGDVLQRAMRITSGWGEVHHVATEEDFDEGFTYVFANRELDSRGDTWEWIREAFPTEGEEGADGEGAGDFLAFEIDFDDRSIRPVDGSLA